MSDDEESDAWQQEAEAVDGDPSTVDSEYQLIPWEFIRKHHLTNLYKYTGFEENVLTQIFENALSFMCISSRTTFSRSESLFITLWFIRMGETCSAISDRIGIKYQQTVESAIAKGLKALSGCFNPYVASSFPSAADFLSQAEIEEINNKRIVNSRFVIAGRHQPFAKLNQTANRSFYISYKFKRTALSNIYIIDRNGICRYVSKSYTASTNDISIYLENEIDITTKLRSMISDKVYILGDSGFESAKDELVVTKQSKALLKVISRFFGRMATLFKSSREPFKFKEELHNDFVRSVVYLMNTSIMGSPLKEGEEKSHKLYISKINESVRDKKAKNAERVRKHREKKKEKEEKQINKSIVVTFDGKKIDPDLIEIISGRDKICLSDIIFDFLPPNDSLNLWESESDCSSDVVEIDSPQSSTGQKNSE